MGKNKYDESYIGKKFNYLTIIGFGYNDFGKRCFNCRCDCGIEKLLITTDVVTGRVKSCGCKHAELSRKAAIIHGAYSYGHPERLYNIYRSMIDRCYRENNPNFKNYGGRGIAVCDEWKESYIPFRAWALQNGYDMNRDRKEQSIDRIDNNKGYSPENCRWTTMKVQRKNQRPRGRCKRRATVIFNGCEYFKRDICSQYGVSVEMFDYRVKVKGMSVRDALTTPKMSIGRKKAVI